MLPYILGDLKQNIDAITPVHKIVLYGSRAKTPLKDWQKLAGKDWDILVICKFPIVNTHIWTTELNYHIDLLVTTQNKLDTFIEKNVPFLELYPNNELDTSKIITNHNLFNELDTESQKSLKGLKFLSLDEVLGKTKVSNALTNIQTSRSFEEISNEYATNSPLGKNSLFYTELKGDYFSGFVSMLPVLYKIGAPMPEIPELPAENQGIKLEEVIINLKRDTTPRIFDYKEYATINKERENFWEYWKNNFAGQAILNKKVGYLDPEKLFYDNDSYGYNLYIPYKSDGNVLLNNPNIEYLKANAAIKITQLDPDAFLIVLANLANSKRKPYVDLYFKKIINKIEEIFKNPKAIDALYEIPIELLRFLKYKTIENIFEEILKMPVIFYFREKTLINILKVLPEKKEFNATTFLNSLLKPNSNKGNNFYILYDKMNDWGGENNFSQLIIELTKIWSQSVYSNPFDEVFKKFEPSAPITYQQDYILGFRNDRFDFNFQGNNSLLIQENVLKNGENIGKKQVSHIFQPVEIQNPEETEVENIKLSEGVKIPAFYLKAFDDKSAWENFEKAVWLTFDVVSTASGIGNLAKLRYLLRTEKTVYIIIKTTLGVIEVASGTVSIGLALIENNKNKELVNKIREYLFWVEICTLGADVLSAKILKQKAKSAQDILEEYRKTVNNSEELNGVDEFIEHLDEVSNIERGRLKGQRIGTEGIEKAKDFLAKLSVDLRVAPANGAFKVEGFLTKTGNAFFLEAHNAAMFITDGKKMSLIIRQEVTVLELLHELMHFRHCEKLGKVRYYNLTKTSIVEGTLIRERYVFDKLMEHKKFLNQNEILEAKYYMNRTYNKYGNETIVDFDFDISKIINKKQEINIDKILNLK